MEVTIVTKGHKILEGLQASVYHKFIPGDGKIIKKKSAENSLKCGITWSLTLTYWKRY